MTNTQNCEAPPRWREYRQVRLPLAPPLYRLSGRVHSLQSWTIKGAGSELLFTWLIVTYRHFAYDIGRNSAPSSSDTGMETNIKSLFTRMMSEPSAEARNSPYPVVSTVCASQQPQADQPGPLFQNVNGVVPSFCHFLEVCGSLHDSAKYRQCFIKIPNTLKFKKVRHNLSCICSCKQFQVLFSASDLPG